MTKRCVFCLPFIALAMNVSAASVAAAPVPTIVTPTTALTFVSHPSSEDTPFDIIRVGGVLPAITIGKHPAWYDLGGGAVWIGAWSTGDPTRPDYIVEPNGTTMPVTQKFTLPDGFQVVSATLQFLADDTASGWINGQPVFLPNFGQDVNCAPDKPGCLERNMWVGDVTALILPGINILAAEIVQTGGASFGAEWALDIQVTQSPVPEPGTATMFGLSLVLAIPWYRRRMKGRRS